MTEHSAEKGLLEPSDPEWRMQGYYIGFEPTGLAAVDRILSSIAQAAKAYPHTDCWQEVMDYDYGLIRKGETCEDAIQRAANEAAAAIRATVTPPADARRDRVAEALFNHLVNGTRGWERATWPAPEQHLPWWYAVADAAIAARDAEADQ